VNIVQQNPRGYRHRRYYIETVRIGTDHWNIWRPDDSHVCSVRNLQEAREAIAEDLTELQEVA